MITEFQGRHRWLSNFAPVVIKYNGVKYPSVEAAYMSAKSNDINWKKFCADLKNSPGQIKRKSKELKSMVENWDNVKVGVMMECLRLKFTVEPYKSLLIATGDQTIQEGNRWGDTFWGVDLRTGLGKNHLGLLIMEIRKTFL